MTRLVLASTSPRRREILSALGFEFALASPQCEELSAVEARSKGLPPEALCLENARRKALAASSIICAESKEDPVRILFLGVDTIVVKDGIVLSKPGNSFEAHAMLRSLQGSEHQVLSGLCLKAGDGRSVERACRTSVEFAPMTTGEIEWYLATGEYVDKAGAYGIQGLASLFVRRIEGCYFNVVGLPVRTLYEALEELGVPVAELSAGPGGAGR
ncbi:MAG: septum formation protein Maf [Candidatus Wallbacteria bacterium]|nr:septum formation protein Maf [Candidatus Wallbacteria bacterium]